MRYLELLYWLELHVFGSPRDTFMSWWINCRIVEMQHKHMGMWTRHMGDNVRLYADE